MAEEKKEEKISLDLNLDQCGKLGMVIDIALRAEGMKHVEICAEIRKQMLEKLPKQPEAATQIIPLNQLGKNNHA